MKRSGYATDPAASMPATAEGPVEELDSPGDLPEEAIDLNVQGRRPIGPPEGFGQLWEKTFWVGVGRDRSPSEIVEVWKRNFSDFWPEGNDFYAPLTGIAAGEVAVINLTVAGGLKLSTGALVLQSDETSFTLLTPEGHLFAGRVTFDAFQEPARTYARARVVMRAGDPLYELGLILGGHRREDRFWEQTLSAVGAYFGSQDPVQRRIRLLDRRRQWSRVHNLRYNAAVRTGLYQAASPARWLLRKARGRFRRL